MNAPRIDGAEPTIEITIRTELTRPALLAVRERIDQLLEGAFAEASPEPPADAESEATTALARQTAKANAAWERLSGNTREYLAACALLATRQNTFSIDDVATEMGQSPKTVAAYHRNVMRTAAAAEPESTRLITSTRSAGRTHLSMNTAVSKRLLELATQGRE
jgi:hypothetical protein